MVAERALKHVRSLLLCLLDPCRWWTRVCLDGLQRLEAQRLNGQIGPSQSERMELRSMLHSQLLRRQPHVLLLVRRHEPEAATRTLGLLQRILNPLPFPENVTGFEEALSKWELTISRWESSASDALNEGVKIALLLKMAPESLRQSLHLQGHTSYPAARAAVVNALLSQHSWQNAPEPMEVGEIGGKRPRKGKAKGKGKQKQQPKQQDKDYSECQCHSCGKHGHISSQCWSKPRKGKGNGKDKAVSAVQVSTSASSASEVGSVGDHSTPGSVIVSLFKDSTIHEAMIFDDDAAVAGWLFAIEPPSGVQSWNTSTRLRSTLSTRCWWTLEQRDVCVLLYWARDAPREDQLNPCLVTKSGELLDNYGCRRVNLCFAESPARLKVAFTILNVRRPILSVGSLLKHGHGDIFDQTNPCLLLRHDSTKSVHRIPMVAVGNTFVVRGRSMSSLSSCVGSNPAGVTMTPVMMEGAAAVSGGDRAVLEQAMDEQPRVLAEEEQARALANPKRPDEETVERHNLTHLPAVGWCDICIRSRGRDAPHREAAAARIDAVRPVIEMVYAEQGKSKQPYDNVKALVAIDRSSGAIFASGVLQKGDDGGYVIQALSLWIASMGYTMLTLHSDNEPAICWVRDKVQTCLTERGECHNGGAERAIQSVRGLARTLVTQVEQRTGLTFGADSPLWIWLFDMLDGS